MAEHQLYEVIFKRKSVRKFDMSGMDEAVLKEIKESLRELIPLDPSIKTSFSILGPEETRGGLFAITAPYYVAAYSEPKEGYLMNIGFMLQQMELLLSSKKIGSCWLGMAKPTKAIPVQKGMEFVIVLAIGLPLEAVHRESVKEFKRKPLEEITNIEGAKNDPGLLGILEAARLSPSATNSQPWYFSGDLSAIRVGRLELNPVKALIYDKMNQVDIGIALCHLWTAALSHGRQTEFVREKETKETKIKGYKYCITLKLSD